MFFDELDVLEIRLNILNEHVGRFVLVEATTTHSGKAKELVFELNRDRFSKFLQKIEYIVVRDLPQAENRWIAENFQRNAITRGLTTATDSDHVVVSDVDEIWNPEVKNQFPSSGDAAVAIALGCRVGCLNAEVETYRPGPVVARFGHANTLSPQGMRDRFEMLPIIPSDIRRGGWHFAWLRRSKDEVSKKLSAFAHSELDNAVGRQLWWDHVKAPTPMNDELPDYIRSNADLYRHLMC